MGDKMWPLFGRRSAKRALFFALALLGLALGENGDNWYSDKATTGLPIYLRPGLPYVTVQDLLRQKEGKSAEWYLPVSSLEKTQEVAKEIRKAWQRLEERYYWRVMTLLGSPNPAPCFFSSNTLDPELPEVKVSFLKEYLPPDYTPPVEEIPVEAKKLTRLDSYTYYWTFLASVNSEDFCHDLGLDIPVFIPTICIRAIFEFCFGPFFFEDRANDRIMRALQDLAETYIPEYTEDVAKALGDLKNFSLTGSFIPTGWSDFLPGGGVVLTPVLKTTEKALTEAKDDLEAIKEILEEAEFEDEKLKAALWPYFSDGLREAAKRVSFGVLSLPPFTGVRSAILQTLQGKEYRDEVAKGIWPLEELKRRFPPSRFEIHESLGYTSYFQVFGTLASTILPDPNAHWSGDYPAVVFLRSLHFWDIPVVFCVGPSGIYVCEVKIPYPFFVKPYILPYMGPRYLWDWVSVPEGYPIPRVRGIPKAPPIPGGR